MYFGTDIGRESFDDNQTALVSDMDGIVSNVFVGYRYDLGGTTYISAEGSLSFSGARGKDLGPGVAQGHVNYGVSALYGIAASEAVSVYGRVGYQVVSIQREILTDLSDGGLHYGIGLDFDGPYDYRVRVELNRTEIDNYDSTGSDLEVDRFTIGAYLDF